MIIGQVSPELAPYLAGPGAAVIALLLVLGGLYALATKHFVPLVAALGKRHLDQIDSLLVIQREESKVITKTLSSIDRRLARLEDLTDGRMLINAGAMRPDSLAG
jgi:hypothetical protein